MTHVFPSGTKAIYELHLASGRSVKASANHPFLALEGWFPLERFDVGDRIAVPRAGNWPPAVGDAPVGADTVPRELWTYIRKVLPNWGLDLKDLEITPRRRRLRRVVLRQRAAPAPSWPASPRWCPTRSSATWPPPTCTGTRSCASTSWATQPVFDATVPGTHNFVADGIVVHNSIEQDADVVMFIYRDEIYNAESPDRGTAEILVSKHRNGPTGMARLAFLDHYTKFANMAKGV